LSPELIARAAKIKMLLMDVDGVLTDGRIYFFPDAAGNMVESKAFDSQDGIALRWCQWKNIRTGVISGRNSPATVARAKQLDITYIYQGHIEKIPILEEIMRESGAAAEEIAFVGDDLTDVVVFHRAGLGVAVANARPEVKAEAHYVTEANGGAGAIRETVELILRARGEWSSILDHYEIAH
jgi:3-deoxy-D-manno-octulosonate 8-phosphate phosphatase (KDO 8-P phosphatase)